MNNITKFYKLCWVLIIAFLILGLLFKAPALIDGFELLMSIFAVTFTGCTAYELYLWYRSKNSAKIKKNR
jgi:hypothetical protein